MDPDIEAKIQEKFPGATQNPPLWPKVKYKVARVVFRVLHPIGFHLLTHRVRIGPNGTLYDMGEVCTFCGVSRPT